MAHFDMALEEIIPAFGVSEDDLKLTIRSGIHNWGTEFTEKTNTLKQLIRQVQTSKETPLLTVLLHGPVGTGKTALASKIALDSGFPFVKLVTPENYLDVSERGKCSEITKIFEDAYKSPLSLIILDDLERLLEYVAIGPRFSNAVLQCLLVLLKRLPPKENHRLLVLATTSQLSILKDMSMNSGFNVILNVPTLTKPEHVKNVFKGLAETAVSSGGTPIEVDEKELEVIAAGCTFPIGIKQLLMVIEMARADGHPITSARFQDCLTQSGLGRTEPEPE